MGYVLTLRSASSSHNILSPCSSAALANKRAISMHAISVLPLASLPREEKENVTLLRFSTNLYILISQNLT